MDWRESLQKNVFFLIALIKLKLKDYWGKKYGKPVIIISSTIVLVFLMNYIGIGFFFYALLGKEGFVPSFVKLRQSFRESVRDERRINLTLKVIDQFGKEVPDYKLAVKIDYTRWYYGLLPVTAMGGKHQFYIKTDGCGIANLKPFFLRKGYDMAFEEVDGSRFVFASGNNMKFQNGSISAKGSATLKWIDPEGKGQYIELKVIRHDPPAKLVTYRPKLKIRQDGHYEGFEAKDENVFTLDFEKNNLLEGNSNGDILLTIKGFNKIIGYYRQVLTNKRPYELEEYGKAISTCSDEEFAKNWVWTVEIEGLKGRLLQPTDNEILAYAPLEGYKRRLFYQIAYLRGPTEQFEQRLKGQGWTILTNETVEKPSEVDDEYNKYKVIGGFSRVFFVKSPKDKGNCYGVLYIYISWNENGNMILQTEGLFNPESNNLWTGKPLTRTWFM
jgi:hypothetical protein